MKKNTIRGQNTDRFAVANQGTATVPQPLTVSDTNPHSVIIDLTEFDTVSLQLGTSAGSTLAGAWTIGGDNKWSSDNALNAQVNPGTFPDVHTFFTALAGVVSGTSDQMIHWNLAGACGLRAIKVTFTAASGTGIVTCIPGLKGGE